MKRTRLEFDDQSASNCSIIKKTKYECIKWDSDSLLCPVDQQALKESMQLYVQNHPNICPNIGKIIAEFALGWIKICPFCEIQEILILPSDLLISASDLSIRQCENCQHRLYIYTCNHVKHSNNFPCPNWFLYWKEGNGLTIDGLHFPYQNICKICCRDSWTTFGLNEEIIRLCSECSYKCCLCNNTFCNKHRGYYCIGCDLSYCEMCQYYFESEIEQENDVINSCINCFYNLEKYVSYYPNLQDRLMFNNYFGSLFDDDDDDDNDGYGLNLIIPSNVIYFIVAFINGNIINCCKQDCKQNIPVIPSSMNYFHHHSPYIEHIVKCQLGHKNNLHVCDSCNKFSVINYVSNIYYLILDLFVSYHPPKLAVIQTQNMINMHLLGICDVCWSESGKVTKMCHDCHLNCYDCSVLICNVHFDLICESCGNIFCIEHWNKWKGDKCKLCGNIICSQCQIIKDKSKANSFNCYNRHLVCNACFSPYIEEFADPYGGYQRCMDIVEVIRDASKFGYIPLKLFDYQHLRIMDIIAVYCCEDDPM